MADVIGPTSTMPGHRHNLPEGATCDIHPDRPAVARVQGETDSMGAELNDLCSECLAAEREARLEGRKGNCDWCNLPFDDLCETRDYEEGVRGPIYLVCRPCRKRANDAAIEELERHDEERGL